MLDATSAPHGRSSTTIGLATADRLPVAAVSPSLSMRADWPVRNTFVITRESSSLAPATIAAVPAGSKRTTAASSAPSSGPISSATAAKMSAGGTLCATAVASRRSASCSSASIRSSSRGAATRRAPTAEFAHDVGLLVPDRLGDDPLAGREGQLATAGRHVEARAAQPPARVVGHEPARRCHERAAFGLARDAPQVARAQPIVPLVQPPAEMAFDGACGADGDRQAARVHAPLEPGELDHPEHLARVGVVHRGRRAGPGLDDLDEVLGGEDLHRVVGRQGGPDRVGPGAVLAPESALHEVHRVRRQRPQLGVAVELQQHPRRVAQDDQVVRLAGEAGALGRDNQLALLVRRRLRAAHADVPGALQTARIVPPITRGDQVLAKPFRRPLNSTVPSAPWLRNEPRTTRASRCPAMSTR
jgi:hypothetical protein